MSEDIVLWLRGNLTCCNPLHIGREAADEIERLRADLAAERELVYQLSLLVNQYASEPRPEFLDALNQERNDLAKCVAKLREALEPFAKLESSWDASKHDWMEIERHVNVGWIRRARAVLKETGGTNEG